MQMNNNLTVHIDAPYISLDEYAKRTGQTREAVTKQCQRGKLPIKPRENRNTPYMINNALLIKQALSAEY
ncbi:hypothetical protein [Reinekea thalattae]|uniref:DNA-binding protein n=1 Tax=Reinekea thalattae TaxID=2593301 RepID=A0A5C8Z421_9GAMM|nr:hypothetical protein [Reinekea thalattae]TXR52054.1 hypothetical protein FME95_11605 [Reinekea thalattae]